MSVLAKARAVVTALNERERLSHGTRPRHVPRDKGPDPSRIDRRRSLTAPLALPLWDTGAPTHKSAETSGTDRFEEMVVPPGISPVDAPSAEINTCHERMALYVADDILEAAAIDTATAQYGSSLGQCVARQIELWTSRLGSLSRTTDPWFAKLHSTCFASLAWPWLHKAVRLGWTDAELFGVDVHAPKIRVEMMGLVVAIATSRHQPPINIVAVTDTYAQITTGAGGRLTHRRRRPSIGRPLWHHPAFHLTTPQ